MPLRRIDIDKDLEGTGIHGRQTRRPWVVLGIVAVVLLVTGALLWVWETRQHSSPTSAESIRRKIAQAQLIGATPKEVMAFLDREGIWHSEYLTYPVPGKPERRIEANIMDPPEPPVGLDYYITIDFTFDENDRLQSYHVDKYPIFL